MATRPTARNGTAVSKPGIVFIEARIRDNVDLNLDELEVCLFNILLQCSFTDCYSGWGMVLKTFCLHPHGRLTWVKIYWQMSTVRKFIPWLQR